MLRVSDDRCGEPNLVFGECDWTSEGSKIGNRIIGGIKTIGPDPAQIGDRRLGSGIGFAVSDPQGRIIAAGIECVDAGPLFCVADNAVEFPVGNIVQLFGDWSVGIDSSARGDRRCGLTRRNRRCCSGDRGRRIVRRGSRIIGRQPRSSRRFGLSGQSSRWCRCASRRGRHGRLL